MAAKKPSAAQPPAPVGRPTSFTQELADEICERIADGESLRKICLAEDKPNKATVFKWLGIHKDFSDQYAQARIAQADTMADEILDISDDGANDSYTDDEGRTRTDHDVIARSRLRVDARKWLAAKMAPKKYGDRIIQDQTIKHDFTALTDAELEAKIAQAGE